MFNFFRRLQWKLTLSYAVVTAGTVLVFTTLLIGIAGYFETQNNSRTYDSFDWSKTAFQDNIPYLLEDPQALQNWVERVREPDSPGTIFNPTWYAKRSIIPIRSS